MKNIFAIMVLFLASATVFAATTEPVDVIEVKDSLDAAFFEKCLNHLEPYEQNTVSCVAVKIPGDRTILKDGGLIGSLNYVVNWSYLDSGCSESRSRLYFLTADNGDLLLVTESKKCLESMAARLEQIDYPFRNKSIYLKKQD